MPLAAMDKLEVTAKLTFANVSAIRNIYHFQTSSPSSVDDLTIAESIGIHMALMYGEVKALMPEAVQAESVMVVNMTHNRVMGDVEWGPAFSGGIASGDPYALGVSAVVRLLTASRGVQGRKFLGTLAESAISTNALFTTSALGALAAFGAYLLEAWTVEGGEIEPMIYNRISHVVSNITGLAISSIPGYQRRRKQGIGQ